MLMNRLHFLVISTSGCCSHEWKLEKSGSNNNDNSNNTDNNNNNSNNNGSRYAERVDVFFTAPQRFASKQ